MVGCLSERYGEELAPQLPEIDGFLGNRDPPRIVDALSAAADRGTGSGRTPSRRAERRPRRTSARTSFPFPGAPT